MNLELRRALGLESMTEPTVMSPVTEAEMIQAGYDADDAFEEYINVEQDIKAVSGYQDIIDRVDPSDVNNVVTAEAIYIGLEHILNKHNVHVTELYPSLEGWDNTSSYARQVSMEKTESLLSGLKEKGRQTIEWIIKKFNEFIAKIKSFFKNVYLKITRAKNAALKKEVKEKMEGAKVFTPEQVKAEKKVTTTDKDGNTVEVITKRFVRPGGSFADIEIEVSSDKPFLLDVEFQQLVPVRKNFDITKDFSNSTQTWLANATFNAKDIEKYVSRYQKVNNNITASIVNEKRVGAGAVVYVGGNLGVAMAVVEQDKSTNDVLNPTVIILPAERLPFNWVRIQSGVKFNMDQVYDILEKKDDALDLLEYMTSSLTTLKVPKETHDLIGYQIKFIKTVFEVSIYQIQKMIKDVDTYIVAHAVDHLTSVNANPNATVSQRKGDIESAAWSEM